MPKQDHTAAITSTPKKRGRPLKPYRTSAGKYIEGLRYRQHDQRWIVLATGQMYREPDERLAIAKFRKIMQELAKSNLGKLRVHATAEAAVADLVERMRETGTDLEADLATLEGSTDVYAVRDVSLSEEQWAWLRLQIIERPRWVAERVGIEEIGYLTKLRKPVPSPKLADLGTLYAAKPGLSPEEGTRCKRFWQEFIGIVGLMTLEELEHDHVELYEQKINDLELSPKSIKHRYTRVKTVVAYALKRGRNPEDCRRALDRLAMLEVPTSDTLDPDPILPDQFWKVHTQAVKAGNTAFAAMMVFSLNCALYPSEAGAVRFSDIDMKRGEFTTRRRKTGVPRVAVLWPETIAVLKALPQERPTVFNTSRMGYQRFSVFRDWKLYREAAKLPDVKFNQIRDASFTAACRVNLDQARVLAGHRMPGAVDNYVMRQPRFVADACRAIHDEFEVAKHIK